MIELETVRDFVLEHFPKTRITKGGTHFQGRCILCGDSKKSLAKRRFNLDYNNGNPIWQCFNCGRSGSFIPLYAEINGISSKKAYSIIFNYDPDYATEEKIEKVINNTSILPDEKARRTNGSLPPLTEYHNYILKSCISKNTETNSYITTRLKKELNNFIKERKIPDDIKLFIAYEGKYRNRIIVPVYDGGQIVYFQARATHESIEPKYKNPIAEKENIILNKDNFDPDKYIIVTEGLIDAFMIPKQGTASLGSTFSEKFLKTLFKLTNRGVIVFFDNDEAGKKAFDKFTDELYGNNYRDNVKYFLFPNKYKRVYSDLNELISNEDIGDVYNFIVNNSYDLVTAKTMILLS